MEFFPRGKERGKGVGVGVGVGARHRYFDSSNGGPDRQNTAQLLHRYTDSAIHYREDRPLSLEWLSL